MLCPPDDPEKFADGLIHAADNRQALQEMGARARALAEREFDRKILSVNFCKVLENVWERA